MPCSRACCGARFRRYSARLPVLAGDALPVGEIDPETYQAEEANLRQYYCDVGDDQGDTVIRSTRRCFGELAPHLVGYVGQIQPEQVAEYERKGYPPTP